MDLLFHEVPVIALLHQSRGGGHGAHSPLHRCAARIEDQRLIVVDGDVVALLQIGDAVGERPDRQGVGADEHLALAITDHQRTAAPRAHDQGVVALHQHADGVGAGQAGEGGLQRRERRLSGLDLAVDQVGDDLGVGVAGEYPALRDQFALQFGEVLDDPVVHDCHPARDLGVGVAGGGRAVGGPAGMADAGETGQRLCAQGVLQGADLAGRAAPVQPASLDGRHARRIIAAVFQPPQAVDQPLRDRGLADDANDAAHFATTSARLGAGKGIASLGARFDLRAPR